jgi:hypothetical protein
MNVLALTKRALQADRWTAAAALVGFALVCLTLVNAKWVSASYFFCISALYWIGLGLKIEQEDGRSSKWSPWAFLVLGVGFSGVAVASGVTGSWTSAILPALLGILSLNTAQIMRRGPRAGQSRVTA